MKLKVCGMKYKDNIQAVASLRPDYMGFIFHEKSPRHFSGHIPLLPNNIKKTGVFVNSDLDFILTKIEEHQLDAVQLHGEESKDFCMELRQKGLNPVEIIKVFSIHEDFDFNQLNPYETVVDYFLFDTKGKLPGGNGLQFNWELLRKNTSSKPFFLSGGIGLEEFSNLLNSLSQEPFKNCHALDVNSRFEDKPGLKNISKLNTLISQLP